MKTIYLGSDHGGFELKNQIKAILKEQDYKIKDLGCDSDTSCDYPLFGKAVAEAVVMEPDSLGIVICGSGVGISIAANRVSGIRCVLANSKELAQLGREHNGANMLALGGRTHFIDSPLEIVEIFLETKVDTSERHLRRRAQLG